MEIGILAISKHMSYNAGGKMYKGDNVKANSESFQMKVTRLFSLESQGKPHITALKITGVYVFLGALWIILSDRFLSLSIDDEKIKTLYSTVKGCIYVMTTGGLIFIFSCCYLKKIKLAGDEISKSYQKLKVIHNELLETERFSKVIIEKMLNAFALHKIILDDKGNPCDYEFVDVNPAFELYTGLKKEDIVGKKYSEIIQSDETTDWLSIYGKVALTGEPVVFESYTNTFDRWFIVNAYSPKKEYFITVFNDITEMKKSEKELRASEERFRLAAEGSNDMIWDLDLLTGKSYVSDRWYDFLGYPRISNEDIHDKWKEVIHPEDRERVRKAYKDHFEGRTPFYSCEYRLMGRNGEYKWFLSRGKAMFDAEGKPIRFAGSLSDINDRKLYEIKLQNSYKQLESTCEELFSAKEELRNQYSELMSYQEKLRRNAYYDSLTGLPNRLSFYEKVTGFISEELNRQKAILYVDLDNFKLINDTMGHSFGDELIVQIGKRLSCLFEEKHTVFRLGGDEFVIFLYGLEDLEKIERCAQRIIHSLNNNPFRLENSVLHVTVSIGISVYPYDGDCAEALMRSADIAMYRAKSKGKNKYVFHSHDMQEKVKERMLIEKHLRTALKNNEYFLYYQPQIDMLTGKISGFEALIRWKNSELGIVPPNKFIGIAEETHLIVPIGEWVLKNACSFLKQLHQKGYSNLIMAVNVSILQLMQEDFVDIVQKTLEEEEIDPKYLELEITESVMMESYQAVGDKLNRLKMLGVRIALDDFGQGYSSLSYLKQLPISTLKIDKSFIDSINSENSNDNITGTIVMIGLKLGLTVIAEGVENQKQLEYLKKHRCHKVQGFLFSKPLPEEAAVKLLM